MAPPANYDSISSTGGVWPTPTVPAAQIDRIDARVKSVVQVEEKLSDWLQQKKSLEEKARSLSDHLDLVNEEIMVLSVAIDGLTGAVEYAKKREAEIKMGAAREH